MKSPAFFRFSAVATLLTISAALLPSAAIGFSDVKSFTEYRTAIDTLEKKGIIEGYADGTFKGSSRINRAEFLKIILESRGAVDADDGSCFPDVDDEWFAKYVCTAKAEGIIEGYPDGTFKPEREINFVEASKILSLAYDQETTMYSPDWYEPFVRALESSKAIPPSINTLDRKITRGEMVEMMWRLTENVTDQPTKAYLNVKYPEVAINLASDAPQNAKSCVDLRAFAEEGARQGGGRGGEILMMDSMMPEEGASPAMEKSSNAPQMGGGAGDDYSQTNVQVEGVDEGDIVKTDGTYLYIVSGQIVRIVNATSSGNPTEVAKIDLEEVSFSPTDLYIEGNRLIVLGSRWSDGGPIHIMDKRMMPESMIWPGYNMQKAEVRIYDVTDRSKPSLERKIAFDGSAVSSRKIDDKLYVVINQPVRYQPMPYPNVREGDVVPLFQDSKAGDAEVAVARCADVMILPHVPSPQYLTVGVIPLTNPNADIKREVVLGSAENIYASLENLYVATTEYNYTWDTEADIGPQQKTNLYRFEFVDNGVTLEAQGSVPGRALNQFSMDEHEGNFRIATTEEAVWMGDGEQSPSTNNFYVLNSGLETVGSIEDIAPGERIYSVRFMGDRTYMVTFKQVDPLFVIDASNPRSPRILGKLKIPGVSQYLHPYDENHIIGFGQEAVEAKEGDFAWFQGMKVSVFDVTDVENPKEMHTLVLGDRGTSSPLLYNHKALLFEKGRDLMAFPVHLYAIPESQKKAGDPSAYGTQVFQGAYVYDFNLDDGFTLRGRITHYSEEDQLKAGDTWYAYGKDVERIVRIGEKLFTISQGSVHRNDLADLDRDGAVDFKQE
ncbi:hypothetical protein A3D88_00745 [Candidatus Peribacteria bacterium RIFCSPHIGHO2_02_FULL_52_16]|nr:MAG: hypothetical protein A2706_00815 [Candidatus Peribacteria bacterium RIFCSPHIGHO2_01_FULL_51_35]OGJ61197.1 MAG: hypothetical protein A3D88_00745 [Candidatus Peribacteria bacterium RIFCSPHIGHO2_02_FULL_52_16]